MEQYDVVIVGAGIAGALVADVLAKKRFSVLALDAGPEVQDREKLLERYYADPSKHSDSPYPSNPKAPQPIPGVPGSPGGAADHYVQTGPDKFSSSYLRQVGGTTRHWQGLTPRLMPVDFRIRSAYGAGVDWPLSYEDIEPWYVAAERELGVSGDNNIDYGSSRSADFPYPALSQSPLDRALNQALKGAIFEGLPIKAIPQSSARDSRLCQASGSCTPICPVGARYDALTHVNRARQNGAVIKEKSVVNRIVVGENGRISHIHYKTWDSVEHKVGGKYFMLSANAIETPKLLLMSAQAANVNVANSSDQVGRNLMDHPAQVGVAVAKKPLGAYLGPQVTSVFNAFQDGVFRKERSGFLTYVFNSGFGYPGGPDNSVKRLIYEQGLSGKSLRQAVADQPRRELILFSQTEMLGNPDNRVTLSKRLDALGMPHPSVHFSYDDYSKAALSKAQDLHQLVFDKVDAVFNLNVPEIFSADHMMGTTRMGTDPKTSVVDANLRSHDHDNLYIAGSGVFPSVGTANPTLTLAALSLRLADHLADKLGGTSLIQKSGLYRKP